MTNLLISKIDDIQVVQVGESEISIKHKKCESNKPAEKGKNPFEKNEGGENKSIDLGAGAKKFKIKLYTFDKSETNRLFDILYNTRYCTVTDKFFGKIKVYIDGLDVTNSDKHITKTIFSINATVQDIEKLPTVNAEAQLKNTISDFELELEQKALEFAETIKTVDTTIVDDIIDATETGIKFVDDALQLVEDGLQAVLDSQFMAFDVYNGVMARVNRIKRIGETLKLIQKLPNDFSKLLKNMTDTQTSKPVEIFTTKTKKGVVIKNLDESLNYLSQLELEKVKKDFSANQLLNLMTAISEMKQALTKEYKSQQEFDEQVEVCIERLEYTTLNYEKVVNAQQILKDYSNQKQIQKLIDYEVKEETPLTQIVFNLYGNLDNYNDLRLLNNLADNDAVIGIIKVYDENIN